MKRDFLFCDRFGKPDDTDAYSLLIDPGKVKDAGVEISHFDDSARIDVNSIIFEKHGATAVTIEADLHAKYAIVGCGGEYAGGEEIPVLTLMCSDRTIKYVGEDLTKEEKPMILTTLRFPCLKGYEAFIADVGRYTLRAVFKKNKRSKR